MRRLASTAIVLANCWGLAAAPGVCHHATADAAVGAWMVDTSPQDTTDPPELVTIAPGGTVS